MEIAIIGGGIGGLAAAVALEQGGHDVRIFERAEAYADVGSGLSLWPNSLAALDALGVGQQVRDRGAGLPPVSITDPRGRLLSRVDPDAFVRRYGEIAMIHRTELLGALRARLGDATLERGVEVSSVEADGTVRHAKRSRARRRRCRRRRCTQRRTALTMSGAGTKLCGVRGVADGHRAGASRIIRRDVGER